MSETASNSVKAKTMSKRNPYIGVTKEGIKILRPKGRVDNISMADARKAVAAVRSKKLAPGA